MWLHHEWTLCSCMLDFVLSINGCSTHVQVCINNYHGSFMIVIHMNMCVLVLNILHYCPSMNLLQMNIRILYSIIDRWSLHALHIDKMWVHVYDIVCLFISWCITQFRFLNGSCCYKNCCIHSYWSRLICFLIL